MTAFGFALVLTAAFCHATWNFLVKRINGGGELIWLFSVIATLLYLPLAAYVYWSEQPQLGLRELGFMAGSVALHLAYFLLLQAGYRNGDLSLVYPTARATGPLLSALFAVAFLGENLSMQTALGALIVVTGVVNLTGGLRQGARNLWASLGFGLAAGLFISSYTVWDAYTVSILMVPPLLLDYASALGRTTVLAPVAYKRRHLVKRYWNEHRLAVFVIALFNPLAYILVLYAMTFTPVIYVAPTRETSVVLSVLAGSILLGEGDLKQRLIWSAVILTGVALLTTG